MQISIAMLKIPPDPSSHDAGRKMENIVAVELPRRKYYWDSTIDIGYYHTNSGYEVEDIKHKEKRDKFHPAVEVASKNRKMKKCLLFLTLFSLGKSSPCHENSDKN